MNDPYEQLADELLAAARRQRSIPAGHPGRRRISGHLELAAAALVAVLVGGGAALAASGILDGSPVKPSSPLNPRAGAGIPAPGGSRLLPVRAPDPEGGLPWGMRIVHTTRGEICIQVGRVQAGQIGELGIDGAFHDDGRFHPIAAEALPRRERSGEAATCAVGVHYFTATVTGRDRNDTANHSETPAAHQREISFGLLGPQAVAVEYRSPNGPKRVRVLAPLGAYLVVTATHGQHEDSGLGASARGEGRPSPSGALTSVFYRVNGQTCSLSEIKPNPETCAPQTHKLEPTIPTRDLHEHIDVQVRHPDGRVEATLIFNAPYTVTGALPTYEIVEPASPKCAAKHTMAGTGFLIERDIRAAQQVRQSIGVPSGLLNHCASSQRVDVVYRNPSPSPREPHPSTVVGSTTVAGRHGLAR